MKKTTCWLAASLLLLAAPRVPARAQDDASPPCANINGDRDINLSDAIYLLNHLFLGGAEPTCPGAATSCGNVNGDVSVNLSDAVFLFKHLGYSPFRYARGMK